MLTAYIGFLKALPTSGPVHSLFEEALVYANRAEKESPEDAIACVDELHDVALRRNHFSVDSSPMARLAVSYGLCEFVTECIKASLDGFQDVSKLLGYALESSRSTNTDQIDVTDMVQMLMDRNQGISSSAWVHHIYDLALMISQAKLNLDMATRHRRILELVLPHVEDVNALRMQSVCWGPLPIALVSYQANLPQKKMVSTCVDLVKAILAHGGNPNAPYLGSTVWAAFSDALRSGCRRRVSVFSGSVQYTGKGIPTDVLAKLVEAFVEAGADPNIQGSLKEKDLESVFPRRVASRILETMGHQAKLKGKSLSAGWTSWITSWVWGK
ncbi:uncharacterized protein PG986_011796 [Apiospora aurea]|uniref:Uncharacterized protein n=1 Tax=Apiospora aurea TaxID=335848 RepID=A0ABR1PY76_9PEZI